LAFLAELAPAVALAPVAGRLADRLDRRRLMIGISLLQAASVMPLMLVHGRGGLPLVYGVIVAHASLSALFDPAKNALLPTLLAPDELVPGNSLIALNGAIGRLAGGPLGGLLLAAGDLRTIVFVDAASFLLAAWLIGRVPRARALPANAVSAVTASPAQLDRRGCLRVALAWPRVRAALLVTFVADIAQGLFVVLFLMFVARRLHGGAGEIGLLRGVQAVGAIGGGAILAVLVRPPKPPLLIVGAALAFGAVDLLVWNAPALTTDVALYIGLFVAVGAPGVALETGLISLLGLATPDAARGRVFAALGVAEGAGQAIGMILAGALAAPVGLMGLLNTQGMLYLAAGSLAAVTLGAVPGPRRASRHLEGGAVAGRRKLATLAPGPANDSARQGERGQPVGRLSSQ
jgi:MFS family permease